MQKKLICILTKTRYSQNQDDKIKVPDKYRILGLQNIKSPKSLKYNG